MFIWTKNVTTSRRWESHWTINQSINDVDRHRLHLSLYVRIVLKTLVLVFSNLSIKLRSISSTGKYGSVINFHILKLPKVINSRLKYFNTVNINYSILCGTGNISCAMLPSWTTKTIWFCLTWGVSTSVFHILALSFYHSVAEYRY